MLFEIDTDASYYNNELDADQKNIVQYVKNQISIFKTLIDSGKATEII